MKELKVNVYDSKEFKEQIKTQENQTKDEPNQNIGKEPRKSKSKASQLIELAANGAEFFHNSQGHCFASILNNGHKETCFLTSEHFQVWLIWQYWQKNKDSVSPSVFKEALQILTTFCQQKLAEVYIRVAKHENCIYLDLCNEQWQVVEISSSGYKIINDPPVYFIRAKGMLALPIPGKRSSLKSELEGFINLKNNKDLVLISSWLLGALRFPGPYPILILHGEQGSGKSTTVRFIRRLIDPNIADLRNFPKDEANLMISSKNSWILAYDNLSYISNFFSDILCCIATGIGSSTRQLYTDAEEVIINVQRPIILNGIEEVVTRNDLLDRAIVLYLPAISEEDRCSEKEFWKRFEKASPFLLGALLDAVSKALADLDQIQICKLPRMADFARWAIAGEKAMGFDEGIFTYAYTQNNRTKNDLVLESSPIMSVVNNFLTDRLEWQGTRTELFERLNQYLKEHGEEPQRKHGWPKTARKFSNELARLAPNLRVTGVTINFDFGREPGTGQRLIKLIKSNSNKK